MKRHVVTANRSEQYTHQKVRFFLPFPRSFFKTAVRVAVRNSRENKQAKANRVIVIHEKRERWEAGGVRVCVCVCWFTLGLTLMERKEECRKNKRSEEDVYTLHNSSAFR